MALAKRSQRVYSHGMNGSKKTSGKCISNQAGILAAFREVYVSKPHRGRLRERDPAKEEMATWYDVSYQAVCNWFDGDAPRGLPTGYQYRTHLWAAAHSYVLLPETFGYRRDGTPLAGQTRADAA